MLGAAVVIVVVSGPSAGDRAPPARALAREAYARGLDHWAQANEPEMLRHFRAALAHDPTYLPALLDLIHFYGTSQAMPAPVRWYLDSLATSGGPDLGPCVRALLAEMDRIPDSTEAAPEAEQCRRLRRGLAIPAADRRAAETLWLRQRFPESPWIASRLVGLLQVTDVGGAIGAARELSRSDDVRLRALGLLYLTRLSGAHRDALAAAREVWGLQRAAPLRLRAVLLQALMDLDSDRPWPTSFTADVARLAAAARTALDSLVPALDLPMRISYLLWRANRLLDNGELMRSLGAWDGAVTLADSLARPSFQAFAYMRRGRTEVKLGDWHPAERDLLMARAFAARQSDLTNSYEVEHNLLHLYEAQGRAAEAREAGERFLALTRRRGLSPLRMMAARDLGWLLQRLGDLEPARRLFAAMVADADSLDLHGDQAFYAGEYFEAIGDLERAARHYRRGLANQPPTRALEALARVAEMTGDVAGALGYAGRHDAMRDPAVPEFRPLLPGLLVRNGRVREAEVELAAARRAATERGGLAGWARLTLDLAELRYRRGAHGAAEALADSAAAAAGRVADMETGLRARGLGAVARVGIGGPRAAGAAPVLAALLRRVERAGFPQLEADLLVMYGDALARDGRMQEALAGFRRAATVTDSIAHAVSSDPLRAGFRGATQLRVTNRALAAVLAHSSDPSAARWFAEWSSRRKARDISPRAAPRPERDGPPALTRVVAGMAPDRAVIDYVVLDTAVAALVLTTASARLVRLQVPADTLRARVFGLLAGTAPRLGTFLDISRATFRMDLARALYHDLLAPLEPLLAGRTRLTIVPDAPLHLLPFDALVSGGGDSTPSYVLDRYTVRLGSSLVGGATEVPGLPPGDIVAVSGASALGPAAGMDREVAAVAGVLRGSRMVTSLVGVKATEPTLRALARDAGLLHVAAHARANEHRPDYGMVILGAAGDDDGLLHVYEIREMVFTGALVVLSACESGTGRLAGGEGPLGLSRAFLQAGASAVVATLWPIGEATSDLMRHFYAALRDGSSTPEALREAKLALRHGSRTSPLVWAAFTLTYRGV